MALTLPKTPISCNALLWRRGAWRRGALVSLVSRCVYVAVGHDCSAFRRGRLAARRHRELGALRVRLGPALHHGFVARVEPYAFLAVDVMVAEEAALPAAERMERGRNGDRHVDPDHARAHAPREVARDSTVGRVARCAVAELVPVDELDRGREVRYAHDRQHGAENLLAPDPHGRCDVVEQRRAEEEALLAAGHDEPAALEDEGCAFADARIDVFEHSAAMGLRDERPHVDRLRRGAVADPQPGDSLAPLLAERLAHRA